jgi:HSP20 family molecular chaperone IbpA
MNKPAKTERKDVSQVEPAEDRPVLVPPTDIYEKGDAILVRCDMPGVDDKHLEVTLENDVLTIVGRRADVAPEGYALLLGEYGTGVYRRAFTITQDIDHAKIKARIKEGVLDLELPKAERAQPKRITVAVNS